MHNSYPHPDFGNPWLKLPITRQAGGRFDFLNYTALEGSF